MTKQNISEEIIERLQQRAIQEGIEVDDLLQRFLDDDRLTDTVPYKTLLECTTDSISLFDPNLRYVYVNPILEILTGFNAADMIGKTDRELGIPEENLSFWRAAWDEVIESKQEKVITFDFATPQDVRTFEARLTPIYDEYEQLVYLLSITRDITERKQTEQMLQDITNRLPGMILRYELFPDGHDAVPYVSEGVNSVYELTVEEALADVNKIWAKVHADDIPGFVQSIQESAKNLTFWDYEWRVLRKDGAVKWVEGLGTPHRMEDGRTVWHTLILDVTERKRLEEQEEELLEQLQLAIETAKLGVWRLNLVTNELYWNDRMLEIYGVRANEFAPEYKTWQQSVHPDDLFKAENRFRESATQGTVYDVEFRIVRKSDGEVRHIYASADILHKNEVDQAKMMIGINMDVTERKHAEEVMLERERLLANLNIEKDRIATFQRIIAKLEHDIRTPLSIISTSRDILSNYFERIDGEQRRERLETIGNQLSYVTQLLNDLTLIQTVSYADEKALELTSHNLKTLCQITLQDIQETVGKEHHLHFEHDFEHDLVLIDDILVNRILLNLLSNAVKYSPKGSQIGLFLRTEGEKIILEVSDQGMGIAEDEQDKIFVPFYRIKTTENHVQGNGLGLSIVKDCVDRHQGNIHVDSIYGKGTTFTIELPLIFPTY